MAQTMLTFDSWMRTEAPVYCSEQYDCYALTRHDDVAAAHTMANVGGRSWVPVHRLG
jgi:hypothetical protein